MSMASKITSRDRTTPPKGIRDEVGVRSGEGNAVRVRRAELFDFDWHRAISPTLGEWDSANDHENFDDL
jgi:hypothetical protein